MHALFMTRRWWYTRLNFCECMSLVDRAISLRFPLHLASHHLHTNPFFFLLFLKLIYSPLPFPYVLFPTQRRSWLSLPSWFALTARSTLTSPLTLPTVRAGPAACAAAPSRARPPRRRRPPMTSKCFTASADARAQSKCALGWSSSRFFFLSFLFSFFLFSLLGNFLSMESVGGGKGGERREGKRGLVTKKCK